MSSPGPGHHLRQGGKAEGSTDRIRLICLVLNGQTPERVLRELGQDPRFEIVGKLPETDAGLIDLVAAAPDVVVFDMDSCTRGRRTLPELVACVHPIPLVMFSSGAAGAGDRQKTSSLNGEGAASADLISRLADRIVRAAEQRAKSAHTQMVVLIGASTGGVSAIETVLAGLPPQGPPVVICQHMPGGFLGGFADRLNATLSQFVFPATDNLALRPGHVYLAPGGARHTGLRMTPTGLVCRSFDAPKRNGHCPSVDELFYSAQPMAGQTIAILLTGLGRDGAAAMQALRQKGAFCIGQDAETSVVYGMPRAAAELDALDVVAPVDRIADEVCGRLALRPRSYSGSNE